MRSKGLWALIALNAVLVACLIGQWLKPNTATAQAAPRPSDYMLIPGQVQGNPAQVIYMIDTQNGWLSARTFDGKRFADMRAINLTRILSDSPAAATPKKPNHGL